MPQNTPPPDSRATSDDDTEAATPMTSRFLFVDIAAQRAKQLRRGALPRIDRLAAGHTPHKLERVAMEEVRNGLILYTLPTPAELLGKT
jgi:DNA-directed RNA polymerase subunit K/omega